MPTPTLSELARQALERWKPDPVRFAHEALGVERIWWRQEQLLRAIGDHSKVACKSGQKTSKSFSVATIAIWWALTRPGSSVVILSPSHRQIQRIIWTELRRLRDSSHNRCKTHPDGRPRRPPVMPLGGTFHKLAEAGWEFPSGSLIVGFTATDPERLRGFSGPDNLYIIDEATGVPDAIWQSIDGNLAGGGRVLAISNPVHDQNWFAECFAEGSDWYTMTISSIEASEIDPPIPGLALKSFVEEKRTAWGENSPEWFAKILGEFPPATADGLIPRPIVDDATKRWTPAPPVSGVLRVGVDVARFGGDKSCIIWSRGDWASEPRVLEGLDVVEVVEEVVDVIKSARVGNERAIVQVDAASVGAGVADILRHQHRDLCTVVDVQAAASSTDSRCSRMRDAVWVHLREWLERAAIPRDLGLIEDVVAPRLGYDSQNRWKVEDKFAMRKRLRRSTDVGDALALAVWQARVAVMPSFTSWGSTRDR